MGERHRGLAYRGSVNLPISDPQLSDTSYYGNRSLEENKKSRKRAASLSDPGDSPMGIRILERLGLICNLGCGVDGALEDVPT